MHRQIVRIAPWQAGKISALVYFAMGILFAAPMALFGVLAQSASGQPSINVVFILVLPFLYALLGLVFAPLACWFYNVAASPVGGLSVTVQDDPGPSAR